MKRKMTGIIVLILSIMMTALCLVACGDSKSTGSDTGTTQADTKAPLIGYWESNEAEGVIYTFNEDGTGTLVGEGYEMSLTYTVKDDTISFTYNGGSEVQTFNYTIEKNVLSIIDPEGSTLTYTKK